MAARLWGGWPPCCFPSLLCWGGAHSWHSVPWKALCPSCCPWSGGSGPTKCTVTCQDPCSVLLVPLCSVDLRLACRPEGCKDHSCEVRVGFPPIMSEHTCFNMGEITNPKNHPHSAIVLVLFPIIYLAVSHMSFTAYCVTRNFLYWDSSCKFLPLINSGFVLEVFCMLFLTVLLSTCCYFQILSFMKERYVFPWCSMRPNIFLAISKSLVIILMIVTAQDKHQEQKCKEEKRC